MNLSLPRKLYDSVLFYPVTTVYLSGVAVATAVAGGYISLSTGVFCLTLIAFLVVLLGVSRDAHILHTLRQDFEVLRRDLDVLCARLTALADAIDPDQKGKR